MLNPHLSDRGLTVIIHGMSSVTLGSKVSQHLTDNHGIMGVWFKFIVKDTLAKGGPRATG